LETSFTAGRPGSGILQTTVATKVIADGGTCERDPNDPGDGIVSIDELVRAVAIALSRLPSSTCIALDDSADGMVSLDEVVGAVKNGMRGCPPT
jgi:hypothetical protein